MSKRAGLVSFAVDELKTLPGAAEFDRSPRRQLAFRSDLHTDQFSSLTSFAYFSDPF